jgi:hypothetical protein
VVVDADAVLLAFRQRTVKGHPQLSAALVEVVDGQVTAVLPAGGDHVGEVRRRRRQRSAYGGAQPVTLGVHLDRLASAAAQERDRYAVAQRARGFQAAGPARFAAEIVVAGAAAAMP